MQSGRKTGGRNLLTCEIELLDKSSIQQVYKRTALGQEVFDAVCRTLEVLEVEYFGLRYETAAGLSAWLDLTKPVKKQIKLKGSSSAHLEFRVKFFVRNPNQLQDEYTRYLFALQLKRDIYTRHLHCEHQPAAKLLALMVQGDLGDYDPDELGEGYLDEFTLLSGQSPELLKDAETHHQSSWCNGLTPAECDYMFLDVSRRLPLYGVEKHPLDRDACRGYPYEIAVSHEGVLVYLEGVRYNTFSWPCVERVRYRRRKFLLFMRGQESPIMFHFPSARQCKRFWHFVIEYHTFFRRIQPPSNGTFKQSSPFRSGSKYRFSGRTQTQIIKEIKQREDLILRSHRSTSPSFKRFADTRKSSIVSRRPSAVKRRSRLCSSPTSLTNFIPAVTVTVTTPEREVVASATSPESGNSPVWHESPDSESPVTKTEVATTAEALTNEERLPAAPATNGSVPSTAVTPATPVSTQDADHSIISPTNCTPREAAALERTFSHHLRESKVADLSDLVRRFSTPDVTCPTPVKSDDSVRGSEGRSLSNDDVGPSADHTGADGDGNPPAEDEDEATPAVSGNEAEQNRGDHGCDENLNQQSETVGEEIRHSQPPSIPQLIRPTSRASDTTISDSSDDNLSFSEERTIRILKRRMTRHSKKKPSTKSFYISQELRDTERSYIADLDMLNRKFRNAIQIAGALSEDQINDLFSQLDFIQQFHMEMMVELENRLILWEGRSMEHDPEEYAFIGDILAKRMSEMRIYTPYIKDQTRILGLVQQWADENMKFRDLYNNFEAEECHLPLLEFFNRPMQRMVHYKLLLDRLIKTYDPSHKDIPNLKAALHAVSDAADYTNRQCRLEENKKKLEELQQELSGVDNLVKPGRYLVREGRLQKAGRSGLRQRHFLLFNDILIYTVPRAIGLPQVKSSISLRDARVELCEDNNPYGENAFALFTRRRSFFLIARSVKERDVWIEDIHAAIEETNGMMDSSRTPSVADLGQLSLPSNNSGLYVAEDIVLTAPVLMPFEAFDACQRCSAEFTLTKRKHHCAGCGQVLCSTCLQHSAVLPFFNSEKKRRVCRDCFGKFQAMHRSSDLSMMSTLDSLTKSVARNPSFSRSSTATPRSPSIGSQETGFISDIHRFSSVNSVASHGMLKGESVVSVGSLQTNTSDEGSVYGSTSRIGSMRLSVPNGIESAGIGESLSQLAELPAEDIAEDTSPPPPGEGSPVTEYVRRKRAQTFDQGLISERIRHRPSVPAAGAVSSPIRRNASMRYDTGRRLRRKKLGVMDDEGIVSSVSNHMSGQLLCRLDEQWKRLWVVCTSYSLFFYKTHHETKPLATIALPEYELSKILPEDGALCELPHSFKLSSDNVTYCFVAESEHAMERWMEVVRNCRAGPCQQGSTQFLVAA